MGGNVRNSVSTVANTSKSARVVCKVEGIPTFRMKGYACRPRCEGDVGVISFNRCFGTRSRSIREELKGRTLVLDSLYVRLWLTQCSHCGVLPCRDISGVTCLDTHLTRRQSSIGELMSTVMSVARHEHQSHQTRTVECRPSTGHRSRRGDEPQTFFCRFDHLYNLDRSIESDAFRPPPSDDQLQSCKSPTVRR